MSSWDDTPTIRYIVVTMCMLFWWLELFLPHQEECKALIWYWILITV